MIPSADIHECRFNTRVRLDQLRDLLQTASEFAARILRTIGGSVWTLVDGVDEPDGFKRFLAGRHQRRIRRRGIHAFEDAGCILIAHLKLIEIVDRDRALISTQRSRKLTRPSQ